MVTLSDIIAFLYPQARPLLDFLIVQTSAGTSITMWDAGVLGPQPSQATIDATAVDPAFLAWKETHGGNPALTRRRLAQEALDAIDHNEVLIRAVVAVTASEVNIIRDWLAAFKVQSAAASSLANLQTRIATLPATPARTLAQVRTAIKAEIASGTVDT